ncbi:MAG: hypothetical protein JNM63_12325 [Spirochaetia bacterium]|nr:hypothetical protein [Spirochaetia bacterium]
MTEDQVFKGLEAADGASLKACRETEGLVLLTRDDLFFPAYYSSSAGRSTTTPESVWGRDSFERYFQAVSNVWSRGEWLDEDSPHTRWMFQIPHTFISELFPGGNGRPEIKFQNGKIAEIYFGGKSFSGWNFRQAVCLRHGWASMKSLECGIEVGAGGAWVLNGSGLGHGVGVSVYGSASLADKGLDFKEILAFYFPKLKSLVGENRSD